MADEPERRRAFTVPETAKLIGLSRSGTYRACELGQLPSVKVGRRILVPADALDEWLANRVSA